MQATIEIDFGPLASEWEPVAFRLPKAGEWIVHRNTVVEAVVNFERDPQLIVRRKWTWPSWLKARFYYENREGGQLISSVEPVIDASGTYWVCPDHTRVTNKLDIDKIGGDWKQSLRENPNWKGES